MVLGTLLGALSAATGLSPLAATYVLAGILFPVQTLSLTFIVLRGTTSILYGVVAPAMRAALPVK